MRRKIVRISLLLVTAALIWGIVYAWRAFPIISGYGAKDLCSCVFVSGRDPKDVVNKELNFSPVSMGDFSVNMGDSSATGTVFGFAKRKAIYRSGFGCTLVNGITEKELRAQQLTAPSPTSMRMDTVNWPLGDRLTTTEPEGINYRQLNKAIDYAFGEKDAAPLRQTRALLVVYNGQLIAEKYGNGLTASMPHTGWSMNKSIINALIGILVRQGKLDVYATTGFPEWDKDGRRQLTIDHLLHANSGLKWDEIYTGPSDVTGMLYKERDMAHYAMNLPLKYPPGTHFTYSSGTSNILSYLIRMKLGDDNYYRFPYEELFNKIGMHSALLELDPAGNFIGSSYCFATARDWARFGLLYLNDGVWNGERILPEGWVQYTATPSKGATLGEYGAQFWLNAGSPGNPANRTYPDVPADCFYPGGHEGQAVWIIPSRKLVVVRLALQQGDKLDENRFLAELIRSLP